MSQEHDVVAAAIAEAERIIRGESNQPTGRFSPEAAEALRKTGAFLLAESSGKSIGELANSGHLIKLRTKSANAIIQQRSLKTELAVLRTLFLPRSGGKDLSEQMRMINEFDKELRQQIPGARAVAGGIATFADLICSDRIPYTNAPKSEGSFRTGTIIDEGSTIVESSTLEHGLIIGSASPTAKYTDLKIVPLVVPIDLRV